MKMKDKRIKDAESKKKHREQIKAKRRSAPDLARSVPQLNERPTILIVCEGENTEPSYFKQFRLSSATIRPVGEGYNTVSLVDRAREIVREGSYEQVWCVFDKDDFSDTDFNNAIRMAEAENYGVAYSNQAFEYWIILHFDDHQGGGMHRRRYKSRINELLKPFRLKFDDKGNKFITDDIFALMEGIDEQTQVSRMQLAIDRAKRNFELTARSNPAKEESSTTVFKLVEELLKYA